MSKKVKTIVLVIVIVIGLYFMPFITVKTSDDAGNSYVVPFLSSFVEKTEDSVIFKSIRSAYALEKDADNAFYSYGESECYGKTYFYDKANDISYYEHNATGAFPTKLEYKYVEKNGVK